MLLLPLNEEEYDGTYKCFKPLNVLLKFTRMASVSHEITLSQFLYAKSFVRKTITLPLQFSTQQKR